MAKKRYKITNYGNTRSVYVKGQTWEISKSGSLETDNSEVAAAWNDLMFVDVESTAVVKQSDVKVSKKKLSKNRKKKVTTKTRRKIKRRKKKGKKNE